LPTVIYFPCS